MTTERVANLCCSHVTCQKLVVELLIEAGDAPYDAQMAEAVERHRATG